MLGSITSHITRACLESRKKRVRHFPLLPTVKVLTLSPKQPHACGNNHALSFSCTNMKVQFNLFDKYCITSGWKNFLSLKLIWCVSRLWRSGWKDFELIILNKVKFYLRCYFFFAFLFSLSQPALTPSLSIPPISLFLHR